MGKLQAYSKYKESGFELIKEVPNHWQVKRLKNVSNVQLSNVDKKSVDDEKDVLLCNYVDVYYNHTIDRNIDFMKATAKEEQIKRLTLQKHDVLLTKDSETPDDIGVPAWVREDLDGVVCGYHLAHVRPNKEEMNGRYLFYLLEASGFRDQFWSSANGVTRYGISKGDIQNIVMFLPTFNEQLQIACFIDDKTSEIDSLIADKEKLIELLEEKRQAIITEAVTKGLNPDVKMKDSGIGFIGQIPEHWITCNLSFVSKVTRLAGYEYTSYWKPQEDGEIVALRGQNIGLNEIKLNGNEERITEELSQKLIRSKLFVGDVVFPCVGSIGKAVTINENGKFHINQNIAKLTPKEEVQSDFLTYFLNSKLAYTQIMLFNSSEMQPSILVGNLRKFKIVLPPLNEQIQIVEHIKEQCENIKHLLDIVNFQITKLKEYRQALNYEAVTGKIDVRDYKKVLS